MRKSNSELRWITAGLLVVCAVCLAFLPYYYAVNPADSSDIAVNSLFNLAGNGMGVFTDILSFSVIILTFIAGVSLFVPCKEKGILSLKTRFITALSVCAYDLVCLLVIGIRMKETLPSFFENESLSANEIGKIVQTWGGDYGTSWGFYVVVFLTFCAVTLSVFGIVFDKYIPERVKVDNRRTNQINKETLIPVREYIPYIPPVPVVTPPVFSQENYREKQLPCGTILGKSGMYKNASFKIESGEELIFGRDATLSHIVIDCDAQMVSRRHCSIIFDGYDMSYRVTDYSKNGTYREDGRQFPKGMTITVPRGSKIFFGNRNNSFILN